MTLDGLEQEAIPEVDFKLTKKVDEESKSPFKEYKITIKVGEYHVVNQGWFSADYALFHIETETDNGRFKAQRKDGDFYNLRRYLRYQYPIELVPPLPKSNTKVQEKVL